MERVPVDIEVYTMDICKKVGHENCPGISVLYAKELELGPVTCICDCHLAPVTDVTQ
jgi:hypothetical protein